MSKSTNLSVLKNGQHKTSATVARIIESRRTIHLFKPEVPPRDIMIKAIDLACWAPNHKLTEPWHYYLLGKETAQALAHLNAQVVTEKRGAKAGQIKLERWLNLPAWLLVTSTVADDPFVTQENYAACCCAIQNMQLYLWSEGIGMKWGSGKVTRDPRLFEMLGIDPTKEKFVGLLCYGYPVEVPETQRKPATESITELP